MVDAVRLAGRSVGPGSPAFVIAEAGVNHNGDMDLAMRLVDAAHAAGVDAVKFQTFRADRVTTTGAVKAAYQREPDLPGESQHEMLRRLELSPAAHRQLLEHCRARGILFLSTPFDEESADLLDDLDLPVFKIPSGELTNLPFLSHVGRKGRPVILSTGMATLGEVEAAVGSLRGAGVPALVLLHCVSNYPADPADANLRAMHVLSETFQVPVGYSDHTLGIEVSLAAVALGACVIEKHLTLDRSLAGPDQRTSLEPAEMRDLVRGIRTIEQALGHGRKEPAAAEAPIAAVARKSLVAARHIAAGVVLTDQMLAAHRPGTGLPPAVISQVVGRRAAVAIPEGTLIHLDMLR